MIIQVKLDQIKKFKTALTEQIEDALLLQRNVTYSKSHKFGDTTVKLEVVKLDWMLFTVYIYHNDDIQSFEMVEYPYEVAKFAVEKMLGIVMYDAMLN